MNNLALKIKSATFDCVDKAVLIRDGADWTVPGKQTANTHTLYARKPAAHTQMAEVTEPVIVSSQKGLEVLHLQTVAPSHPRLPVSRHAGHKQSDKPLSFSSFGLLAHEGSHTHLTPSLIKTGHFCSAEEHLLQHQ